MAWIDSSQAAVIPGVITISTPFGPFKIGRISLTFSNGTFQQIGKVWSGSIYYIYNGVSETAVSSGFEVLACLPQPQTMSTVPPTTTTLQPCGRF